MSLNWNLSGIADEELLHNVGRGGREAPFPDGSPEDIEGTRQWNITNALIWATIAVGMGSITEANWQKFLLRLRVTERLTGAYMNQTTTEGVGVDSGPVSTPYYFTAEDVKRRIGMTTNVSTEADTKFRARMSRLVFDDAQREVKKAIKAMDKELTPA